MSSNVFLAPTDSGNFNRTVLTEIDLSEYPDHPDALSEVASVRFWGARDGPRNEDFFDKMEAGDLILFYQDGMYVGSGWVRTTFEDTERWASTTFWENAPSTLIYTIEGFTPLSVPNAAVNRIFDYAEGYNPQGLIRVGANRVKNSSEAIKLALERYTERHT